MRRVIKFTQVFPDAEIRNNLLNELISGTFDYEAFNTLCKECHLAYDSNGNRIEGAYMNQWEAIEAAGKNGSIRNMQGILNILFIEI